MTRQMIDFEDARAAVEADVRPRWAGPGALMVADDGFEDADAFLVVYGAREWLVDEDLSFLLTDPPIPLVSKETGEITWTTYLADADRIDAMTPVEDV